LPAHFDGIPGYFALATARRDDRKDPWTPVHEGARVAIVDARDAWFDLTEGTPFVGVSREGILDLKYSEQSEIPYGWDDVPTVMTGFKVPKDLAEQPVWVLPADLPGARDSKAFAPVEKGSGTWQVGPFTVVVTLSGQGGEATVTTAAGGSVVHAWTTPTSADIEPTTASLDDPFALGVPRPLGAFRLPDDTVVLLLRAIIPSGVRVDAVGGKPGAIAQVGRRDLILGSP